ncbi:MAG TPA: molybdenum cofactor guanylyltransferase [Prosthecobacter sp.]
MSAVPAPFAALLLAGGMSSRMGQDKAQLPWLSVPLWQMQARKLKALQPEQLLIACRQEQALHESVPPDLADAEWLFDLPGQGNGPLLPILNALRHAGAPLLVLAVDMPEMTAAFLREMLDQRPGAALFFRTAEGIEPLGGIYTPSLIPLMEKAVEESRFSLRRLIGRAADLGLAMVLPLSSADAALFANANTPGEWRKVAR